jgi:hypothetical protein
MLKINTLLSTAVLSIIFVQGAQAAAPAVSAYPYSARLNAGPVATSQVIEATMPASSLRFIREDFGNIQLVNERNEDVDFQLFDVPAGPIKRVNTIELSDSADEAIPENLFDDNRLTTFRFDERIEANSPATILVDFGKLTSLHRIELWPTFSSDIKGMELRAGLNRDSLSTLKRQTEFSPLIDSDYAPTRWLEISLWGTNVTLEDVNFFAKGEVKLYFTAEPDQRYKVLYGDDNLNNNRFKSRVSEAQESDLQYGFSTPEFNAFAAEDFDGDTILNIDDNCPLVSNKSQTDQDEDRIGDPCDNAVEVKNFSQLDVDRDGVADLIDNCKLMPNPDQKNRDNDEFGDECDNAYATESVFEKWTGKTGGDKGGAIPYGLIGGLLALVAILVVGVRVGTKK